MMSPLSCSVRTLLCLTFLFITHTPASNVIPSAIQEERPSSPQSFVNSLRLRGGGVVREELRGASSCHREFRNGSTRGTHRPHAQIAAHSQSRKPETVGVLRNVSDVETMEPLSLFKLALYCAEGTDEDSHTISRNLSLAAHLYRLAGAKGVGRAWYNLGVMYGQGEGVEGRNLTEARRCFELAAEGGDARGMSSLGWMYLSGADEEDPGGEGLAQDLDLAHQWLSSAARAGDANAMYGLATLHQEAGPYFNESLALSWLERAAEEGDGDAKEEMGEASMELGRQLLLRQDHDAAGVLQKGVRWGSGEASYLLGMCYRQGFGGVQTDQHLAARYLAMALVRNASEASIELARMYLDGAGPLKQDLARAAEVYSEGARLGCAQAAFNLAVLYVQGRGVEADAMKAVPLLLQAQAQNITDASYLLGTLHIKGQGVPRTSALPRPDRLSHACTHAVLEGLHGTRFTTCTHTYTQTHPPAHRSEHTHTRCTQDAFFLPVHASTPKRALKHHTLSAPPHVLPVRRHAASFCLRTSTDVCVCRRFEASVPAVPTRGTRGARGGQRGGGGVSDAGRGRGERCAALR